MASRTFHDIQSLNQETKLIVGSFAPNGSSAVSAASNKGRGWSVARTSVGLFTITLADAYPALISHLSGLRQVAPDGTTIAFGAYDSSAKTIKVSCFKPVPGFIPLDITSLREIASNDIQNLAAHGGILASDSAPSLARVNGATDKALRVIWAASNSDEVAFPPVPKPADLDGETNLEVHLLARMAGTTDTPTIDIQVFDGVGDTEMGGVTAALSDTLSDVSFAVTAANLAAHPGVLNIALVPGAHTTDALWLYAAWIEYTRQLLTDLSADADTRINFALAMQNSGAPNV